MTSWLQICKNDLMATFSANYLIFTVVGTSRPFEKFLGRVIRMQVYYLTYSLEI